MKVILILFITILIILYNRKNTENYNNIIQNIPYTKKLFYLDDLKLILSSLKNYVIIRDSNIFPEITPGCDIDILTNNLKENYNIINKLKLKNFTKKLVLNKKNIIQFDLFLNNKFYFKLDFTNNIIHNNNYSLNKNITNNIINNKVLKNKNGIEFYLPNDIDNLAIRYCEYKSKDKQKHLNHVNKKQILFNKINSDIKNYNINYDENGYQHIHKFNFFLVWNHGIKYITNILDIISKKKDIKIVYIKKVKINNIDKLIDNIYKYDLEGNIHIKNKTKYLKQYDGDIFIILCLNHNYQEVSDGKTKNCKHINKLKWDIRELFNPKHQNKNFFISDKLSRGVTHNHVIHANDTENEVFYIFKYLKLQNPFYYVRNSCLTERIDGDFHLDFFSNYTIKNININEIKCNISDRGVINIEETPHYKFVNGEEDEYISYFNKYIGTSLTQNHTPNRFRGLIRNFDYNNYNNNNYYLIIVNSKYVVQDGLHRLSILKKNNINYIKVVIK